MGWVSLALPGTYRPDRVGGNPVGARRSAPPAAHSARAPSEIACACVPPAKRLASYLPQSSMLRAPPEGGASVPAFVGASAPPCRLALRGIGDCGKRLF